MVFLSRWAWLPTLELLCSSYFSRFVFLVRDRFGVPMCQVVERRVEDPCRAGQRVEAADESFYI